MAIGGVLLVHVVGWPAYGGYGVSLFFALSSFLITTLLLEERDQTGRVALPGVLVPTVPPTVPRPRGDALCVRGVGGGGRAVRREG